MDKSPASMSWDTDQERMLSDANKLVKRNAYFMKKAMDEDNMKEALKYSAAMLGELRTSQLSPHKYYELYIAVFGELCHVEHFFSDEHARDKKYSALYNMVQHAGNVLPRLYLMVLVGCLYIKSGEAKPKEILKDLVDMCKGVQHPTRGLFLRHYLCQQSRGMLPGTGAMKDISDGGDINDALDFLLSNFIEMNKLWVRMQHQGSIRDREKREKERQELQDLVGKNLTYLSQLDGLDYELYSSQVLPRVIEQIVSCKDDIAQQYLMQCVIQCFPDAFHLGTLDTLLGALPNLQTGVKLHALMAQLMDRLAKYAESDSAVLKKLLDTSAFVKFKEAATKVAATHVDMQPADMVEMFVALMSFTNSVHPESAENVNHVLGECHAALAPKGTHVTDPKAEKLLVELLALPLEQFDPIKVLALNNYPTVMGLLLTRTHKQMATRIVNTILKQETKVGSEEQVVMLFTFIAPLTEDMAEESMEDFDEEDFEDEQMLVAKLLHQLWCEDLQEHFKILRVTRDRLEAGGAKRMNHTLPALVFCTLQLVRRITTSSLPLEGSSSELILQWVREVCLLMADIQPMMALRLLLCCAHSASEEALLEDLAYDFFEQAFTLYEEDIADKAMKRIALQAIVGTLHRCYIFTEDNRDALVQTATSYSAKLYLKTEQCRALCVCSHLSWQDPRPTTTPTTTTSSGEVDVVHEATSSAVDGADSGSNGSVSGTQPPVRDAKKVLICLRRALKLANAAAQQKIKSAFKEEGGAEKKRQDLEQKKMYLLLPSLHVEILNHYLYYFDQGSEMISASVVQQLIDLIHSEIKDKKVQDALLVVEQSSLPSIWANTIRHIECKKVGEGDTKQRYASLQTAADILDGNIHLQPTVSLSASSSIGQ